QHEAARAVPNRDVRDPGPGERVVADSLEGVRLEQRDVLVRRRVENDARAIALEDLAHLRAVAAVAENGRDSGEVAVVEQFALDVEQGRLRLLDEHEPRGPDACDLTAELGADRAPRTGHDDRLAGQVRGDEA